MLDKTLLSYLRTAIIAIYRVYYTGILLYTQTLLDASLTEYTQYLQSIPFIPGKYCPRISTQGPAAAHGSFLSELLVR